MSTTCSKEKSCPAKAAQAGDDLEAACRAAIAQMTGTGRLTSRRFHARHLVKLVPVYSGGNIRNDSRHVPAMAESAAVTSSECFCRTHISTRSTSGRSPLP
ncbi:hypothetical protein [Cryobacterium sp. TMS1-13-1]|uniref:hypothetical protein n=1 Tax=Cryobacterium sp. TMS1-13-1 TaxID=1259220 RepID=UPI00106A98F9|nr:hypothetical protein [Cryobacterium sp. TMS1-13-1]TFD21415.1 hypothetical protein E3T31_11430 [Cryobacterium sp. TMS1-13-1]